MSETMKDTTAGPACHGREIKARISAVLEGLDLLSGLADAMVADPNFRLQAAGLGWLALKMAEDAVKALDAAARIERASCRAVAG